MPIKPESKWCIILHEDWAGYVSKQVWRASIRQARQAGTGRQSHMHRRRYRNATSRCHKQASSLAASQRFARFLLPACRTCLLVVPACGASHRCIVGAMRRAHVEDCHVRHFALSSPSCSTTFSENRGLGSHLPARPDLGRQGWSSSVYSSDSHRGGLPPT